MLGQVDGRRPERCAAQHAPGGGCGDAGWEAPGSAGRGTSNSSKSDRDVILGIVVLFSGCLGIATMLLYVFNVYFIYIVYM